MPTPLREIIDGSILANKVPHHITDFEELNNFYNKIFDGIIEEYASAPWMTAGDESIVPDDAVDAIYKLVNSVIFLLLTPKN